MMIYSISAPLHGQNSSKESTFDESAVLFLGCCQIRQGYQISKMDWREIFSGRDSERQSAAKEPISGVREHAPPHKIFKI